MQLRATSTNDQLRRSMDRITGSFEQSANLADATGSKGMDKLLAEVSVVSESNTSILNARWTPTWKMRFHVFEAQPRFLHLRTKEICWTLFSDAL